MRFEEQYPNIDKHVGLRTRIVRRYNELRKARDRERRERLQEFAGLAILFPVFMAVFYMLYYTGYIVSPDLTIWLTR